MRVLRRCGVGLAALSVVVFGAAAPSQASVATSVATSVQAAAKPTFAAISVNVMHANTGWAVNAATKVAAVNAAQTMCKKGKDAKYCRNIAWVSSGCVAVAVRYKGKQLAAFGGGFGKTTAAANAAAVKKAGAGSKVTLTKCTR